MTAKAIQSQSRDMQDWKTELTQELMDIKNDFTSNIKIEFNNFKTQINHKLQNVVGDVCNHGTRLNQAEQQVERLRQPTLS